MSSQMTKLFSRLERAGISHANIEVGPHKGLTVGFYAALNGTVVKRDTPESAIAEVVDAAIRVKQGR